MLCLIVFSSPNGVQQGTVFSPISFAVYLDPLLEGHVKLGVVYLAPKSVVLVRSVTIQLLKPAEVP